MAPLKHKVPALLGCALVCVIAVWLLSRPTEPVYRGKTLTLWLKTYCYPQNPTINDLFPRRTEPIDVHADGLLSLSLAERGRREEAELERRKLEAADAVRHIGTNALPVLLRGIDKDMPSWKLRAAGLLEKLPRTLSRRRFPQWWLVSSYELRNERTISGFVILQTNAAPAVAELARRMNTRASRSGSLAIIALAQTGSAGLKPLLAALNNTNAINRVFVARCMHQEIRNLPTNDVHVALEAVANHVADADTGVATWSAIDLGSLGMEPEMVVPVLTRGLSDPRAQVRFQCANALGNLGAAASSAIPNLRALAADPDPSVKTAMKEALQQVASQPKEH